MKNNDIKKILVVDDDTEILWVVKLILTQQKYAVQTINRWADISQTVEQFTPDLILMDIDLGGADGSEICKSFKQAKEHQAIPVILFSVYNMPGKYVKESLAQGFINKPFDPPTLIKLIKDNLN